jgi:hypothetical protein
MDSFGEVAFCLSPLFVLAFALAVLFRVLRHRERMQAISKGLLEPDQAARDRGSDSLRWGIVIASIGLALTLGLWPLGLTSLTLTYPLGVGPWMLIGFIPFFLGLGLVIVHLVSRPTEPKRETDLPA